MLPLQPNLALETCTCQGDWLDRMQDTEKILACVLDRDEVLDRVMRPFHRIRVLSLFPCFVWKPYRGLAEWEKRGCRAMLILLNEHTCKIVRRAWMGREWEGRLEDMNSGGKDQVKYFTTKASPSWCGGEGLALPDCICMRSLKRSISSPVLGLKKRKVGCRGDRLSEHAETRSRVAGWRGLRRNETKPKHVGEVKGSSRWVTKTLTEGMEDGGTRQRGELIFEAACSRISVKNVKIYGSVSWVRYGH
jgi:hypothetical protein